MRVDLRAWVPPPARMAGALAGLLGLELLFNRVLTRTAIFLPAEASTAKGVVAGLGTFLMVAVGVLSLVALLGVAVHEPRKDALRMAVAAFLVAVLGSIVAPSLAAGTVVVVLAAVLVLAFLGVATRYGVDPAFSLLLGSGLVLLAYFHAANAANQASRAGLPVGPAAYVAGELLVLLAIGLLGVRSILRGVRPVSLGIASAVVGLLLVLYVRGAAVFAATAYWALGTSLFVAPLFFATAWLGLAGILGARARGDATTATVLGLLLFAGIDVRVSYIAAAIVLALVLSPGSAASARQEKTVGQSERTSLVRNTF